MSDEIQFGELEQASPEPALRPDQDAHFLTTPVGQILPEDLPIFVDLDVMRDMEAHARSNTQVELGGVLLGRQHVDRDGRPFVVVTDNLRAEHYEATQGSFKFTHETWTQITRQRQTFHPDLEMVGWYHTHPGWSVFLSGMDLFICEHFFNGPLDVALVIDPCQQDRGWFQWSDPTSRQTRRTAGFILTTGRHRQAELESFARLYNKEPDMNLDPRYASQGAPIVVQTDRRSTDIGVMGLLIVQSLLILFLIGRGLGGASPNSADALAARLDQLESQASSSLEARTYRELLSELAASRGGAELAEQLASSRLQQERLEQNLAGQLARIDQLDSQRQDLRAELEQARRQALEAGQQLESNRQQLAAALADADRADGAAPTSPWLQGPWLVLWGALLLAAGGLAGFAMPGRAPAPSSRPPAAPDSGLASAERGAPETADSVFIREDSPTAT